MAEESLISVIIPLYNGTSHIVETLQSILAQSHRNVEVLVIDDGSTDDGPAVVEATVDDARVRVVRKPNEGIALTRNEGLRRASSDAEFVVFMDHDDVVAPSLYAQLLAILADRQDAVAAYAIADYIDAAGAAVHDGAFAAFMRSRSRVIDGRVVAIPADADATFDELFLANHIYPPSGLVMRKQAIDAIGGFDARYRVADDWDAVIRLSRSGPIVALDEVLVGYRRHSRNASSDTHRNVRETRAVWARTYYSKQNEQRDLARLRAAWRGMQRHKFRLKSHRARQAITEGRLSSGLQLCVDAAGHLLLLRPLRRWAR